MQEPMELQLDYWSGPAGIKPFESQIKPGKDSTKSTLKTTFRALQVQRLPMVGEVPSQAFVMSYTTKEKKQKS